MAATIMRHLGNGDGDEIDTIEANGDRVTVGVADWEHAYANADAKPWIVWLAVEEPDRVSVEREQWEDRPDEPDLRLEVNERTVIEGFSVEAIGSLCHDCFDYDDMSIRLSIAEAERVRDLLNTAIARARQGRLS